MTKKQFLALEKRLLPQFPGFAVKGSLMLIPPVQHALRGFCFDATRWNKKDFHVEVFFMPLGVPANYLNLNFGHRLRRFKTWNADEDNLEENLTLEMQKEVPFLMGLKGARELAEAMKPDLGWNPNCHEAFAYSLLQAGELPAGLDAIDALLNLVASRSGWEADIASRARGIKEKALRSEEEVLKQLSAWEDETARNLGLDEFRPQSYRPDAVAGEEVSWSSESL